METNILILIAIPILAVSGFIFLAHTMIALPKYFSQRKGSLFSSKMSGPRFDERTTPEDCYDECMKKSDWASSQAHLCALSCNL
ncbi:MAG: hypothetical protein ACLQPD_04045 [Desulfomonilaceae bacterium]